MILPMPKEMLRFVLLFGNRNKVSDDLFVERLNICKACKFCSNQVRCLKCLCPIDKKCLYEISRCPEGYWQSV